MNDQTSPERMSQADEFTRQAEKGSAGILRESIDFLRHNKKWWLLPILLALFLVGVLVVAAGGPAAPFIYTLF